MPTSAELELLLQGAALAAASYTRTCAIHHGCVSADVIVPVPDSRRERGCYQRDLDNARSLFDFFFAELAGSELYNCLWTRFCDDLWP